MNKTNARQSALSRNISRPGWSNLVGQLEGIPVPVFCGGLSALLLAFAFSRHFGPTYSEHRI
jgi:hypothetical protein